MGKDSKAPSTREEKELPKYYSGAKLTLGDMEKTLTVGQAMDMLDAVQRRITSTYLALIEHWTDGEGLHMTPFENDVETDVPEHAQRAALEFFIDNRII